MNSFGRSRWNFPVILNGILVLQLLLFATTGTASARRQHNVAVIGSSSRRLPFTTLRSGLIDQVNENSDESTASISHILDATILDLRGGAKKRGGNRKARTATLSSKPKTSSSSTATSATGAKKAAVKEEKKTIVAMALHKLQNVLPLTRVYMSLVMMATLLGLILGEENAQAFLALDPVRVIRGWELWRPLTAASFLGKPSMSWLMSSYFLFEYGTTLERTYGSAQFLIFLLTQVGVLGFMSSLLGQPFFAQSVITAMLHCVSRANPHQQVKWIVFTVPMWMLPYCLMVADVLQTQQIMSILPHVMGILAGHFYYFHKFVWPKKRGGVDWLAAPDVIAKRMDPNAKKKKAFAEALAKKMKSKGRARKGRKLSDK